LGLFSKLVGQAVQKLRNLADDRQQSRKDFPKCRIFLAKDPTNIRDHRFDEPLRLERVRTVYMGGNALQLKSSFLKSMKEIEDDAR